MMTEEQLIKQFRKYIDKVIKPKYPDILDYEVNFSSGWEPPLYNFNFIMDGTEQEVEDDINDDLQDMTDLFGIRILRSVTFTTYD